MDRKSGIGELKRKIPFQAALEVVFGGGKGPEQMYMRIEKEDWNVLSDLAYKIADIVIDEMDEGKDQDGDPDYEEKELHSKMWAQLEFMELKYGPHPLILDTKADFSKSPDETVRLKEEAKRLCLTEDFELRGSISKDIAEIRFLDTLDYKIALMNINEALEDLMKANVPDQISEAMDLKNLIQTALRSSSNP